MKTIKYTRNVKSVSVLKKAFGTNTILIWITVATVIFFSCLSDTFREPENLLAILRDSSINASIFLGLTLVIAVGEIDLTFGEIAGFSGMIAAYFATETGLGIGTSILIAIVIASVIGLLNGFLIGWCKFPAMITTIAISSGVRSIAQLLKQGGPIYINNSAGIDFIVYGNFLGIPIIFIIVLVLYLATLFFQNNTTIGQHMYALGDNRKASIMAGINEHKSIFFFFIISAFFSSLGGLLLMVKLCSGSPNMGSSFFMDGLTAVYLGAMIFKKGKPNVMGTLVAVILIATLTNGLTLLGKPGWMGMIIKGILLVIGVILVTKTSRSKIKSII